MTEETNKYQEPIEPEPELSLEPLESEKEPKMPEKQPVPQAEKAPAEGEARQGRSSPEAARQGRPEPKVEAPAQPETEKPEAPVPEKAPEASTAPDISGKKEGWVEKLKDMDDEGRVETLIGAVLQKELELDEAIKIARRLKESTADELHAVLTKRHDELVEKRIIKER